MNSTPEKSAFKGWIDSPSTSAGHHLTSTPKSNHSATVDSSDSFYFKSDSENSFSEKSSAFSLHSRSKESSISAKSISEIESENTIDQVSNLDFCMDSLPVERFVEQHIAENIKCNICLGVPLSPVMALCGHFHCKKCLTTWLDTADTCPACRRILTINDVSEIRGFCENVHQVLHVYCQYKENGCCQALLLREIDQHEASCQLKDGPLQIVLTQKQAVPPNDAAPRNDAAPPAPPKIIRKRGSSKTKLALHKIIDIQDCKTHRLKPFYDFFENTCKERYENKIDVLFFMLKNELRKIGDNQRANEIDNIWKPERKTQLSVDQCLALRVDNLMTKGQYKAQYGFFEQNIDKNVLQPPSQLDAAEKHYLPGETEYQIIDKNGDVVFHHTPDHNPKPIDVLQSFDRNNTEVPVPNVKGVRWNYPSALAQSLKEVDAFFDKKALRNQSDTDQTIHTVIKDGADGLGEVSVYKERDDKFLPDKAFRFSFVVMSSHCILTNSEKKLIYDTENPNSVRTNRPLFEVIADENNKASVYATLVPIER